MSIPLLVATTNAKKLIELQELLDQETFRLLCLKDLSHYTSVEESGKNFEENAILKATGYAEQSKMLTLAEDSGLCCDALEGAPGIYSARFSETGKDEDNNRKLLQLLKTVPDNCRGAHYVSAIAIANGTGVLGTAEGKVHGYIVREPRGSNGFGYDPIFYYPPFEKTFGQSAPEMKNKVSHRSKALEKAVQILAKYAREQGAGKGKPGR